MRPSEEPASAGFVRARYGGLLRYAVLLTGDRGQAEDLLLEGLARTYGARGRVAPGAADAYTRTTPARLALRGRRRRWLGGIVTASPPDRAADRADPDLGAAAVRAALAALPADQRIVLVPRCGEWVVGPPCTLR